MLQVLMEELTEELTEEETNRKIAEIGLTILALMEKSIEMGYEITVDVSEGKRYVQARRLKDSELEKSQ